MFTASSCQNSHVYSKFMPKFSSVLGPLYNNCQERNHVGDMGYTGRESICKCQNLLTFNLVLVHFISKWPCTPLSM